MKTMNRNVKAARILLAALLATAMLPSMDAAAQTPPSPAEIDKLVKYSQCIRANGYPEFPDPGPDGRMQIKLDPKTGARFEAAQRACKDKMPSGMANMEKEMTPQRMQALLGFADCMRGKGVKGFPDPSPNGVFEFTNASADIGTPQVQEAAKACQASNPTGGLMFRRNP